MGDGRGTAPTRVVIKLGGTTLAEQRATLEDVARLSGESAAIVVHGGGRRLTEWLARLGIETAFEGGRRVTDEQSLEVAVAVLGGVVNAELVAALRGLGANAVGITGIDGGLIVAERDHRLGRVAIVRGARPDLLDALLAGGWMPVVAPLALDESGVVCNVNADDIAAGLAGAVGARLVLLTDTDGVRDGSGRTLHDLDAAAAEELIHSGVIAGGMVPKVRGSLRALTAGAIEVVIADGRAPSALARSLGDRTFGTRLRLDR